MYAYLPLQAVRTHYQSRADGGHHALCTCGLTTVMNGLDAAALLS
jgi:hypothetical protein